MAQPIRVGILNDMADPRALNDDEGLEAHLAARLERETQALVAAGRLTCGIEIVHAYALGLPSGTVEAVEKAFYQLADSPVDLIIGPFADDNAAIVARLSEEQRVPTINVSSDERTRGRYTFQIQSGSPETEAMAMAMVLKERGCESLTVVREPVRTCERLARLLETEARLAGLSCSSGETLSSTPDRNELAALHESVTGRAGDALVFLGSSGTSCSVFEALSKIDGPRLKLLNLEAASVLFDAAPNSGSHEATAALEGWYHFDLVSNGNATLRRAMDDAGAPPEQARTWARAHDLARVASEGLARAPTAGRNGVRMGLEQVKWLASAHGEEGTMLGFGLYQRGGLQGRFLVLHEIRDGSSHDATSTHAG